MTDDPRGDPVPPKAGEMTKRCDGCHYALTEDYGWSNWTTEGTVLHCLKRLHPVREGFDMWYHEDKRLLFAEECAGFSAGDPIDVDVDQENVPYTGDDSAGPWWHYYTEDAELRALIALLEIERASLPAPADDTDGKP